MLTAYEIMTRSVASVTPDTPISQVATLMRDLNIGDVLVLENGRLRGIVTDRDLTIHALTNGGNSSAPVENYMSPDVVTGQPDWSVERLAQVMGENQVRRLPIVQNGAVLGIVSLGDVAVHSPQTKQVGASLRDISENARVNFNKLGRASKLFAVAIPLALGAAILWLSSSKQGRRVRRQIQATGIPEKARDTLTETVQMLQDPKTREAAWQFLQSSGLPDRAREAVNGGMRTLQDSKARDTVMQLASQTQDQVGDLSQVVSKLANKAKDKRF